MSYYHEDPGHDDYPYEYEYKSYSDYPESDHRDRDPEPPPSELNLYEYDGDANATEFSNNADREYVTEAEGPGYETEDGEAEVDELGELQYENEAAINEGCELGELERDEDEINEHGRLEYEAHREECEDGELDEDEEEIHEPEELEYAGDEAYEQGELEDERNKVRELWELAYGDDETHELEELERMANEEGYEPHALEHHNGAPGTNKHGHASTRAYAHPTPTYVPPIPFSFISTPSPRLHNPSNANQRGHVTALRNRESAFNNAYNGDDERCVDNHNTSHPTSTHTLCYTQEPEPNTDELLEHRELELMYEKWGCEPPGLEGNINEVYNTNGLMYDNSSDIPPPDYPNPTSNLSLLPRPPTFLKTLCHGADNGFLS